MEDIKSNEATHNRPEGDRLINAPVLLVDLPDFIKQIKKEKAWKVNDRNAITVFKSEAMRIVMVALHKKVEMTTEQPENAISIQVLEGKLEVYAGDKKIQVSASSMLVLQAHINYRIVAGKKSVFLLTLVN